LYLQGFAPFLFLIGCHFLYISDKSRFCELCYIYKQKSEIYNRTMKILLLLILSLAVYTDLKSKRISNRLILIGYVCCFFYPLLCGQYGKAVLIFIFLPLLLVVMLPLFQIGIIGGGDCKLLCLCIGFLGIKPAISVCIYAFLLASIYALILAMLRKIRLSLSSPNQVKFAPFIFLAVLTESLIGGIL